MLIGKVLWWDAKDGNGIIRTGDGTRYYFDQSVLKNIRPEKVKARLILTFHPNPEITSCLCATNVEAPSAKAKKSAERKFYEEQQLGFPNLGGAA